MKKLRSLVILTLTLAFATTSISAQETYYQTDENFSTAYAEGSNTANWTVYIPITLLVGAAIWFGLADRTKDKKHSSNSQDGLGSIADSKRISHAGCYRSSKFGSSDYRSYSYRSKTNTYGSFSHSN